MMPPKPCHCCTRDWNTLGALHSGSIVPIPFICHALRPDRARNCGAFCDCAVPIPALWLLPKAAIAPAQFFSTSLWEELLVCDWRSSAPASHSHFTFQKIPSIPVDEPDPGLEMPNAPPWQENIHREFPLLEGNPVFPSMGLPHPGWNNGI